jgi:hypothetical protein
MSWQAIPIGAGQEAVMMLHELVTLYTAGLGGVVLSHLLWRVIDRITHDVSI